MIPDISKLDFRVGKIVECEVNPASDKIYMEKIDMGNGEIREISSGLQKHYTLEQMIGAMVVVICNLKPRKVAGNMSAGMVMCAQLDDGSVIEFLTPPEGSQVGDAVTFEGYERKPLEVLPAKKSPFDAQVANFIVADGVGCWKDGDKNIPFNTPKGICKAPTVKSGLIK